MFIVSKIENLKKQHKYSNIQIAKAIKMSRGGFETMMKSGDMKLSTLRSLAKLFNVPITYFFEEKKEDTNKTIEQVFEIMKDIVKERI